MQHNHVHIEVCLDMFNTAMHLSCRPYLLLTVSMSRLRKAVHAWRLTNSLHMGHKTLRLAGLNICVPMSQL